jgi:hypothetical protein
VRKRYAHSLCFRPLSIKCRLSRHLHLRYFHQRSIGRSALMLWFGQDEHRACATCKPSDLVGSSEPSLLVLIVRRALFQMCNASVIGFAIIQGYEFLYQDIQVSLPEFLSSSVPSGWLYCCYFSSSLASSQWICSEPFTTCGSPFLLSWMV